MNKKQLTVTWIALGLFVITLLAAPWSIQTQYLGKSQSYTENGPIWDAPANGTLSFGTLLVEWLGLGVVWGVLVMVLKTGKMSTTPDKPNLDTTAKSVDD